ncbi:hypothetical protein [uncultured Roseobacter sp.]|uniref:hypothetical protein n=1 Tax=uncultured Roseobacter sp. TaxID=114847 RepID=UPI00260EC14A|nr:hypothetical protein [uncultured Roseobacter sp.]
MHIVIGLLVAFVLVAIFARRNRGVRRCRWREDRAGNRGSLRKYRCAACGAEAFTAEKGTPRKCLAELPKT